MLHLGDQAFTGSLPRPGRLLRNYDGSSMMSTTKRHTMTLALITRESVLLKIHSLEKRQTARPDVVMGMFVLVLVGMAVGLAMRMIVIAAVHAISPCKRSPRCYTIGTFLEHSKARLLARCCKSKFRRYAIAVQQPWNCSKSKRKRLRFSLSNNSCWGASACSLVFSLPVELELDRARHAGR